VYLALALVAGCYAALHIDHSCVEASYKAVGQLAGRQMVKCLLVTRIHPKPDSTALWSRPGASMALCHRGLHFWRHLTSVTLNPGRYSGTTTSILSNTTQTLHL
jgi:hypothetical protein